MDTKQYLKQQRGKDFEEEIRRSWSLVPNCWRMRIASGKGSGQGSGTRPADEIILLKDVNILAEHKRTESDRFELNFLTPNQIKGLLDFDRCIPKRNRGMVFVSFLNEKQNVDRAFAFRLIAAMNAMNELKRRYITMDELYNELHFHTIYLYRRAIDNKPGYDLREVEALCYKYL